METVYIETTVISYLASKPSRDLLVAAHQQATLEWWNERRGAFRCYVSQVVLDEVSCGDSDTAESRLSIVVDLQVLSGTADAEYLARAIVASGAIPERADRDAAHIAIAAVNGIDYLLTWNCKHLANAQIMRRVDAVCAKAGFRAPVICTPEELMGE